MKHVNDLTNKEIFSLYVDGFITDSEVNINHPYTGFELKGDNVVFYPTYVDECIIPIGHFAHALNNKPTKELEANGLIPFNLTSIWK